MKFLRCDRRTDNKRGPQQLSNRSNPDLLPTTQELAHWKVPKLLNMEESSRSWLTIIYKTTTVITFLTPFKISIGPLNEVPTRNEKCRSCVLRFHPKTLWSCNFGFYKFSVAYQFDAILLKRCKLVSFPQVKKFCKGVSAIITCIMKYG